MGSSATDGTLTLLLLIELTTDLGKSFHEVNHLMVLISDSNLSIGHMRDARVKRFLECKKLIKLTYKHVLAFC